MRRGTAPYGRRRYHVPLPAGGTALRSGAGGRAAAPSGPVSSRHGFSLPPAHGPRLGQPYMKMRHFFGNSLVNRLRAPPPDSKKSVPRVRHERTRDEASANETKAASVKAAHGLHPCTDSNPIVIVHASVQMSWRAPAQCTNGRREARRHNRQLLSPTIEHGQVNLSTCDAGVRHPIPRMR